MAADTIRCGDALDKPVVLDRTMITDVCSFSNHITVEQRSSAGLVTHFLIPIDETPEDYAARIRKWIEEGTE